MATLYEPLRPPPIPPRLGPPVAHMPHKREQLKGYYRYGAANPPLPSRGFLGLGELGEASPVLPAPVLARPVGLSGGDDAATSDQPGVPTLIFDPIRGGYWDSFGNVISSEHATSLIEMGAEVYEYGTGRLLSGTPELATRHAVIGGAIPSAPLPEPGSPISAGKGSIDWSKAAGAWSPTGVDISPSSPIFAPDVNRPGPGRARKPSWFDQTTSILGAQVKNIYLAGGALLGGALLIGAKRRGR